MEMDVDEIEEEIIRMKEAIEDSRGELNKRG
jgi:hypothetical protein